MRHFLFHVESSTREISPITRRARPDADLRRKKGARGNPGSFFAAAICLWRATDRQVVCSGTRKSWQARMQSRWLLVPVVVLMSACGAPKLNTPVQYNSSVITEEEITASGAVTAYDAIKKLHANFLSYRGRTTLNNTSSPDPTVYLD